MIGEHRLGTGPLTSKTCLDTNLGGGDSRVKEVCGEATPHNNCSVQQIDLAQIQ